MNKKLGIIQSRGIGDILIALPIAKYYYDQGWSIYWPICEEFMPNFENHVPWIKWIPIPTDPQGKFFYDTPLSRLRNFDCTEILPLYQSLSNKPEFSQELFFQHTNFDQYKYLKASVPFKHKWLLKDCITRNHKQEQLLFDKLVTQENYAVIHLQGWDHTAEFDRSILPTNWQIIEITKQSNSIFDWITILEKAQSIIAVDSGIANMIDQLEIGDDLYFLPRSHIHLTPVMGQSWNWIQNLNLNPNTKIFRSS